MSLTARTCIHQGFCRDSVHVIVATVAFGMGKDLSDEWHGVNFVIYVLFSINRYQ
jgi:superfamily II DNA helicase RecQ